MFGAAANASWYAPLATVAAVPITPTRPFLVAGDRPPDRGQHHLDHRHVVPLPGVAQAGRAGRVAGDHQHLDARARRGRRARPGRAGGSPRSAAARTGRGRCRRRRAAARAGAGRGPPGRRSGRRPRSRRSRWARSHRSVTPAPRGSSPPPALGFSRSSCASRLTTWLVSSGSGMAAGPGSSRARWRSCSACRNRSRDSGDQSASCQDEPDQPAPGCCSRAAACRPSAGRAGRPAGLDLLPRRQPVPGTAARRRTRCSRDTAVAGAAQASRRGAMPAVAGTCQRPRRRRSSGAVAGLHGRPRGTRRRGTSGPGRRGRASRPGGRPSRAGSRPAASRPTAGRRGPGRLSGRAGCRGRAGRRGGRARRPGRCRAPTPGRRGGRGRQPVVRAVLARLRRWLRPGRRLDHGRRGRAHHHDAGLHAAVPLGHPDHRAPGPAVRERDHHRQPGVPAHHRRDRVEHLAEPVVHAGRPRHHRPDRHLARTHDAAAGRTGRTPAAAGAGPAAR